MHFLVHLVIMAVEVFGGERASRRMWVILALAFLAMWSVAAVWELVRWLTGK